MILGIGVDTVSVERVRALRQAYGERFLNRVFTRREIETAAARASFDERLATRFAAKEAFMKALGTGWREGVHFTQIEVRKHPTGRPELVLKGVAQQRAQQLGCTRVHLSLSHAADYAVAFVILEGGSPAQGSARDEASSCA